MKHFFRDYFSFNRRERNGVFVLLAIIVILVLYLSFSNLFYSRQPIDFSKFDKEIAEFEEAQKLARDSTSYLKSNLELSGNELVENKEKSEKWKVFKNERKILVVEINAADTTELKKVRGIGTVFAKRIVKFRDALGGFRNKEQLLEVYGLDLEKYKEVEEQMSVDSLLIRKLNINIASVNDLSMHPYISKKEAVAIFTRRIKQGDYTSLDEIKKLDLISEELYVKIKPYLTLK